MAGFSEAGSGIKALFPLSPMGERIEVRGTAAKDVFS
jgi:hypothetical protein